MLQFHSVNILMNNIEGGPYEFVKISTVMCLYALRFVLHYIEEHVILILQMKSRLLGGLATIN